MYVEIDTAHGIAIHCAQYSFQNRTKAIGSNRETQCQIQYQIHRLQINEQGN
jgi:hypothetical protein